MKRKIFTLLVAFMALAAFHANAQYGLTVPYNLNVKAQGYPYTDAPSGLAVTGALTVKNGEIVYKNSAGEFANLNDYFAIEQVNSRLEFRFRHYETDGSVGQLLQVGGVSSWEVVRFTSGVNPKPYEPLVSATPSGGGFVCAPSATNSSDPARQVLVRVIADNSLALVYADKLTAAHQPIWVEAGAITGRWAQKMDFYNTFPDFIQIKDKKNGVLTVKDVALGGGGKSYDKFKVALTGNYNWTSGNTIPGVSKGQAATYTGQGTGPDPLGGDIHLFSLIVPECGSKLVTVADGRNVFGIQAAASNNVLGDSLIVQGQLAGLEFETQMFAIWIDVDGSMSLYPRSAYTYTYGNLPGLGQGNWVPNQSILLNAPYVPLGTSWGGRIIDDECYNIGFVKPGAGHQSAYAVAPTTYATSTEYEKDRSKFYFYDVTAYNTLKEKRYYYLETKVMGRDGKPLILDAVLQQPMDGDEDPAYKLVLTDRDKNRFVANGNDTVYYNTPYDSLNLSACWEIEYVYNTDYATSGKSEVIGYRFRNEEGVVLQYAVDPALPSEDSRNGIGWEAWMGYESPIRVSEGTPGSPGGLPFNDYRNYFRNVLVNKNDSIGSDVWKTIGFSDDTNGYFFLTNLLGMKVADLYSGGTPVDAKYLKPSPLFDARLDTSNNTFGTNYLSTYFKSGTGDETNRRLSFYNTPYLYHNLLFNQVDSVVHRNTGNFMYKYNDSEGYYETGLGRTQPADGIYDLANTYGLEIRLAEIHVNEDPNVAPHDSILNGQDRWDRYEVDSLWNYLYKKPGTYAIKEALGWTDLLKSDGNKIAMMGLPNMSTDTIQIELADSLILTTLAGTDSKTGPSNNYKWFYISKVIDGQRLYLTYDGVRPNLTNEDKDGFRFTETLKSNAAAFRFYQPLVADKEQEYFIMETVVPLHYYTDNAGTISTRLRDTYAPAGETRYAVLIKDSKQIGVTADQKRATRWDFVRYGELPSCRIDYIDNDFLADTKMYGAPLKAYNLLYPTDSITPDATEGKPAVTFTLVPAVKIEAKYKDPSTLINYGRINGYYYGNNTTDCFEMGDETRPVQLYYVRQVTRTENGSDTTYLTTTGENVYSQDLNSNKQPSVSGDILEFQKYRKYANVNFGGISYTNDSTLLQMYAVYGKLGTDDDRPNGADCITPYDIDFHFGQFIFIPAAAYQYDYTARKALDLKRNLYIGNNDVSDEFRVGAYSSTKGGTYKNKLIVVPGKEATNNDGVPASEYIFSYVPYAEQFACPNFIEDVNGHDIASDGRAVDYHDYADPSVQWTVNKLSDNKDDAEFYLYDMAPVALKKRNQATTTQTQLTNDYYLFLIKEEQTEYGGYKRTFTAVKKYYRNPVTNEYVFGVFSDDVRMITITQITNKYIGDVKKVKGDNRIYDGDSTIDYFYKFEDGAINGFNWAIIESVLADRYVWSRDWQGALHGTRPAFVDTIRPDYPAKFLTLQKSNIDTIADCNGTIIHTIPYYNIVYTDPTGDRYYLQMDQSGKAEFVWLNDTQSKALADYYNNPDLRPEMKFCFPYKMKAYNSIEYVNEKDASNEYYNLEKVFVQSRVGTSNPKPVLLKVEASSAKLAGEILPDLFTIDYTEDMDATTWFFGSDATSDDEWIRLQQVPQSTTGWLRDPLRAQGNDWFVAVTGAPENDVDFAVLDYKDAIAGGVDMAEYEFKFIDSTLLGSYASKKIWYYNIINKDGKYLTSAGFDPNGVKPADSLIWQGEGYAYFADKLSSDPQFKQLFGLKRIKPADDATVDPWYFWVVAGVDSTFNNDDSAVYYYLADVNDRMVFRYAKGGTSRQTTEETAMKFQFGQVDNNNYTDIDGPATTSVLAIGGEGYVKVYNAEGAVELYTIDGRNFKTVKVVGEAQTISAPAGVYIVKIGTYVAKVLVK